MPPGHTALHSNCFKQLGRLLSLKLLRSRQKGRRQGRLAQLSLHEPRTRATPTTEARTEDQDDPHHGGPRRQRARGGGTTGPSAAAAGGTESPSAAAKPGPGPPRRGTTGPGGATRRGRGGRRARTYPAGGPATLRSRPPAPARRYPALPRVEPRRHTSTPAAPTCGPGRIRGLLRRRGRKPAPAGRARGRPLASASGHAPGGLRRPDSSPDASTAPLFWLLSKPVRTMRC